MILYSLLFKNFPQFVVIHTVKRFGVVNKQKMFFWNSLAWRILSITLLVCEMSAIVR